MEKKLNGENWLIKCDRFLYNIDVTYTMQWNPPDTLYSDIDWKLPIIKLGSYHLITGPILSLAAINDGVHTCIT